MKYTAKMLLIACFALVWVLPVFASSPYGNNANQAVQWLSSHQNIDGSWGAGDTKYPSTAETVLALQALNQRNAAYYWGITWLENNSPANIDYMARRVLALAPHGSNVSSEMTSLQTSQAVAQPGNNGWGLTSAYQGSPLDSALALLAYSQQGVTTNVIDALAYLKSSQLTAVNDMGWPVAQETTSDPATTALVVLALTANKASDSTLNTNIANGITALTAKVSGLSPTHIQALASLAYVKAGYPAQGAALLNSLTALQAADGSWGQDSYATAITVRAMAAAIGSDLSTLSAMVSITDPNLRAAINSALGRNSMDALNKGDLAGLTSLDLQNRGITNLTGLEWAVNLTSIDLRGNNVTSFTPLNGLTYLAQVLLELNLNKTGTGAGTVTSSSGSISCSDTCSPALSLGDSIALTATPTANSTFAGWSGACTGTAPCQFTMDSNKAVTATFNILPPVAAFSASSTAGGTPFIATITDQSQRATSWSWNFGDGATSSEQNPTHVYKTPGSYTVTLTAANTSGSATASKTITVFGCQNQPVRILETNVYYPSLATALGAALDGQTIQLQEWNFAEGATISKTVTLDGGYDCGFATKTGRSVLEGELHTTGGTVRMKDVRIAGTSAATVPVISVAPSADSFGNAYVNTASGARAFTIGNSGGANLTIGAISLSGANSGEFVITADACSGKAVTPGASCAVQVAFAPVATGARTAVLATTSNDPATPTANVTLNGIGTLPVLAVQKSGTGSGTVSSSPTGISCGSGCSGGFMTGSLVTLTAFPDADSSFVGWSGGCSGIGVCTVAMTADLSVTAIFNKLSAVAGFGMTATSGGAPLLVNFTSTSQFATSWLWDFGDGATSSEQNPGHVYKAPGTYTATLTATNVSGSTSASNTITVTPCGTLPVRIGASYYPTLQSAYDSAADGNTIQALAFDFAENLAINRAVSVVLEGGYMCGFSAGSSGMTIINGEPHTSGGSVTLRNFRVKQ